jgi:uncharacterized membrane protein YgdD (TMEM256/DUF423 family)
MNRRISIAAALFGMIAIVLGAFGAHGLKAVLNVNELTTFETGVKYQMYHALFLLFVATSTSIDEKTKNRILYFITSGILMFSGSIYLLVTDKLMGFDLKAIGFVTPIGGMLLVLGWLTLFLKLLNKKA